MYVNKWLTFTASAFLQTCAGISYCFSIYGPGLKELFGLSQTQLQQLGFCVNLGGYLALLAGSLYDSYEEMPRWGPRLVVWLGCLVNFTGYAGMWAAAIGLVPSSFLHLCMFAILAGNAGTWFDTCALVTNVRNFPNERGSVVGVLKSFLGLSGSIYASVYLFVFEGQGLDVPKSVVSFLLFLATAPSLIALGASTFINHVPFIQRSEIQSHGWLSTKGRFMISYIMVGALAVYQMSSALMQGSSELRPAQETVVLLGMVCLLSFVFFIPCSSGGCAGEQAYLPNPKATIKATLQGSTMSSKQSSRCASPRGVMSDSIGTSSAGRVQLRAHAAKVPITLTINSTGTLVDPIDILPVDDIYQDDDTSANQPLIGVIRKRTESDMEVSMMEMPGNNYTLSQSICSLDMWLLVLIFGVGVASGLVFLNNMGEILVAMRGNKDGTMLQVVPVSLFSVANAAGRLLGGYLPERLLHNNGMPRTLSMIGAPASTLLTMALCAWSQPGLFYLVSVCGGFAFGFHWSVFPSVISDLFGLRHFAANYSFLQLSPAALTYLLATCLAGSVYDHEATRQGHPQVCFGPECFRRTFLYLCCLMTMCCALCLLVARRSAAQYKRIAEYLQQVDHQIQG